jgi:hypothetical protein
MPAFLLKVYDFHGVVCVQMNVCVLLDAGRILIVVGCGERLFNVH